MKTRLEESFPLNSFPIIVNALDTQKAESAYSLLFDFRANSLRSLIRLKSPKSPDALRAACRAYGIDTIGTSSGPDELFPTCPVSISINSRKPLCHNTFRLIDANRVRGTVRRKSAAPWADGPSTTQVRHSPKLGRRTNGQAARRFSRRVVAARCFGCVN